MLSNDTRFEYILSRISLQGGTKDTFLGHAGMLKRAMVGKKNDENVKVRQKIFLGNIFFLKI